jgi:hypothetical protein
LNYYQKITPDYLQLSTEQAIHQMFSIFYDGRISESAEGYKLLSLRIFKEWLLLLQKRGAVK